MTLRQLLIMHDARQVAEWDRTGAVLAMIANVNRDPKKVPRAYKSSDFNPFAERKAAQHIEPDVDGFSVLKSTFVKGGKKK